MKLVVIAALTVIACIADTQGAPEDEAAIRKIVAESAAAFNRHEPALGINLKAITTKDFDVVIPPGEYGKAGPELDARTEKDRKGVFRNARIESTVTRIRFIRPDVAIVDGTFMITASDVKPDPKGLDTFVMVKEGGVWRATALRRMIPVVEPGLGSRP